MSRPSAGGKPLVLSPASARDAAKSGPAVLGYLTGAWERAEEAETALAKARTEAHRERFGGLMRVRLPDRGAR